MHKLRRTELHLTIPTAHLQITSLELLRASKVRNTSNIFDNHAVLCLAIHNFELMSVYLSNYASICIFQRLSLIMTLGAKFCFEYSSLRQIST